MKTTILLLLAFIPGIAFAQLDTEQSRQSLVDIRGFYVTVDVEGSVGLTSDEALNVSTINRRVKSRLREAGLNVLEGTEVIDQPREPYLYLHINMLEMDRGLVPFATSIQFFQRVELPGKRRNKSLVACTWDTGVVGLVSLDNLDMIPESAIQSVNLFIDDFARVNP